MINAETLAFIIAAFCQFENPRIQQSLKYDCAEYMMNCTVKSNGVTTNKIVDMCKAEWADHEVRARRNK